MRDEAQVTYTVHVHKEAGHCFWAEVEELPGCFAAGESMDELWQSLEEAVGLYLSSENVTTKVRIDAGEEVESVVEKKFLVCS